MYWEGTQQIRPNERPFALHRNASAGIQRYGGFIWSGDVQYRWETLATHVSVGINTGLSGLPLWGTDIGGFDPTSEYTGELHVRWFQFGAFCPLLPRARAQLAFAAAMGMGRRRRRPVRDQQLSVPPEELKNARRRADHAASISSCATG